MEGLTLFQIPAFLHNTKTLEGEITLTQLHEYEQWFVDIREYL